MTRASAVLVAATILVAGCSGGSEPEGADTTVAPSSSTTEASTTTTTAPTTTTTTEATTTTVAFAFPDDPGRMIAAVQLTGAEFGADYIESDNDDPDDEPLCDGVDSLNTQFPPQLDDQKVFEGDHLFFSNVGVYPTAADADAAFDYLRTAYERCNEGIRIEDGQEILLAAIPFSPPSILGADRLTGLALDQTTPDVAVLVQTRLITVDRLLIFVGGSDPDVVQQMAEAVVARTREPAEPESFAPVGSLNVGPGYTNPAYYSFAEGPDQLRALGLSEASLMWLNTNSLERVDEVASSSCVATQQLTPGDSGALVDEIILGVFSAEDRATYPPEALGEVYGAANGIYCPGLSEYLTEVIDAIPG